MDANSMGGDVARPFFSILLPTRNRSEIVGGSVQSVVSQSEPDWELVVSDNDESPELTRDVVSAFRDPRIRYLRTSGQLSMHDNWENALKNARGAWILVLEDKQRLAPKALAFLRSACAANPDSIVSYPFVIASREDLESPRSVPRQRRFRCEAVVEEFCRFSPLYWDIFPRALTSCAPKHLFDRARELSRTGMVFSFITPDYASGFQLLNLAKDLVHLREPVIVVPPSVHRSKKTYSNGQASMTKQKSYDRFMASIPIPTEVILEGCGIPSIYLWPNLVIHDFRRHYRRAGHSPSVHGPGYLAQCFGILLQARIWGTDVSPEIAGAWKLMRAGGPVFMVHALVLFSWRTARSVSLKFLNRLRS
jgi:glycosyltransferase involved in cell wall biosynthesis